MRRAGQVGQGQGQGQGQGEGVNLANIYISEGSLPSQRVSQMLI